MTAPRWSATIAARNLCEWLNHPERAFGLWSEEEKYIRQRLVDAYEAGKGAGIRDALHAVNRVRLDLRVDDPGDLNRSLGASPVGGADSAARAVRRLIKESP